MHMRRVPSPARSQGVSLIEAMVALAVMSFGMLALVGVQATMRFNSDVARQRTEATRIASEDIESMRLFSDVVTTATQTQPSWDQLASNSSTGLELPGNTANTTFSLERTVNTICDGDCLDPNISAASMKLVETKVEWADRTAGTSGEPNQSSILNTVIVRAAPALSAALALPADGGAPSRQGGRHISIPVLAKDLGDGRSAFKPFDRGTTVWVLNNTTGQVTSVCTAVASTQSAIMAGDLTTCSTVLGRLVTGKVRFNLSDAALTAAGSEFPSGPALPLNSSTPLTFYSGADNPSVNQTLAPNCVADVPDSAAIADGQTETAYACLMFPDNASGWGGQLNLVPGTYPDGTGVWEIGNGADQYKVCRYTLANSPYTINVDHPKTYCKVRQVNPDVPVTCSSLVTGNLSNQNFLIIRAANSCPTDGAINPLAGDLVNSNTLPHQP